MPGGVLIQTNSALFSKTAHGVWVKTADGEYDWTWLRLFVDSMGVYTSIRTNRSHARIGDNPNLYTSSSVNIDTDLDGNFIQSTPSTGQATRVTLAPMP